MNQKQAKRLRRAQRQYVKLHKPALDNGPMAAVVAFKAAAVVETVWPNLNHKGRGQLGSLLADAASATKRDRNGIDRIAEHAITVEE